MLKSGIRERGRSGHCRRGNRGRAFPDRLGREGLEGFQLLASGAELQIGGEDIQQCRPEPAIDRHVLAFGLGFGHLVEKRLHLDAGSGDQALAIQGIGIGRNGGLLPDIEPDCRRFRISGGIIAGGRHENSIRLSTIILRVAVGFYLARGRRAGIDKAGGLGALRGGSG